jgi:hypothetical protein
LWDASHKLAKKHIEAWDAQRYLIGQEFGVFTAISVVVNLRHVYQKASLNQCFQEGFSFAS